MVLRFLFILILSCSCSDNRSETFTRVVKGSLRETITETGELQAVRYKVVTMPSFNWRYGRPKVTFLEKEGSQVEKGDVVGEIETGSVVRELGESRAKLEQETANLIMQGVEHKSKNHELAARLHLAQASLNLAGVDTQGVRMGPVLIGKMRRLGYRKAELIYQKADRMISATKVIQEEERRIQLIKLRQMEANIEKAGRALKRFILRAPGDGMIEYRKNRRTHNKVAVGDQLYPGSPIVGLPDLSEMKVLTQINETDIERVWVDQEASVRLDAFPKMAFKGKVIFVSRICKKPDKNATTKVFDVVVLLEGADPVLKPGMTVRCELLVAEVEDALLVENECIREEAGEFVLYVKKRFGLKRVPVVLGPRNSRRVVVRGDVKVGDSVVLSDSAGEV